ncbi:MAG: tRNA pseudouridine(55) synthase TruB [Sphingobium sp.]|nr:tRNA pseudouridine(55) synthase TruB [Sphingobium sp.]
MKLPLNGWIILDKPYGLGSTQAVGAVKRCLREGGEAKTKIGHGGTLDPLASGVLPVALGEATKLAGRMLDSDKVYDFTVLLGSQTDTLDTEGQVIAASDHRPTQQDVVEVIPRFIGPIEQMPPAFSALKVDGRRAYDLARAGEEVVLKSRNVTIHALSLRDYDGQSATFSATVSKGTYIRSLARDIALALGTVGHVTMLRRTKAGPFTLDDAISLDKLQETATGGKIGQCVLPLTTGLDDIPALAVTSADALALRQGKIVQGSPRLQGLMLAMDGDVPVALVEGLDLEIKVVRGFNL